MSIQYDADASRRASLLVGYIGGYAPSSRLAGRAPRRHPGHSVSGESLRHPKRPGWGIGRVIREEGEKIEVYFEAVGPKPFVVTVAGLQEVADADVAEDDMLRHLKRDAQGKFSAPPLSFEDMVQNFLRIEGGGFDRPRYVAEERIYKDKAVALAASALDTESLRALLERGAFTEIFDACVKVAKAASIINPRYDLPALRRIPGRVISALRRIPGRVISRG
jgi:hypothetical protein